VWGSVEDRLRTVRVKPVVYKRVIAASMRARPVEFATMFVATDCARRGRPAPARRIVGLRVGTTPVIVGRRCRPVSKTARSKTPA